MTEIIYSVIGAEDEGEDDPIGDALQDCDSG
jgi:hypothetical protein